MSSPDVGELIKRGKFNEALAKLEGKKDDLSLIQRSVVLERLGEFSKSLKIALKVCKTTHDPILRTRSYVNMAYGYWRLGQLRNAFGAIEDGLQNCENIAEDHILRWKGELYYVRGILNDMENRLMESRDDFLRSYDLRMKYGDESLISHSLNALGVSYQSTGDLDRAFEYYKKSLELKRKIGNSQDIARSLVNIGNLAYMKGDYTTSVDAHLEALGYFESGESTSRDVISSLGGLANAYYNLGVLDEAQKSFHRAYTLSLKNSDPEQSILTAGQLMMYYLNVGDTEKAEKLVRQIKTIATTSEGEYNTHLAILNEGNYEKHLPRHSNKAKAYELFKRLLDQPGLRSWIRVSALIQIIELLLQELLIYSEGEVLNEINQRLEELEVQIKGHGSNVDNLHLLVLKGKLMSLLGDHNTGSSLLSEALILADNKGYHNMAKYISSELDMVDSDFNRLSLRERLSKADLSRVIHSMNSSSIPVVHHESETPISLLIIDEGGTLRYSYLFENSIEINEFLIGAYLNAINNFSQEVFGTPPHILQRIEQEGSSILVLKISGLLLSYIYRGNSYSALQRLKKFGKETSGTDLLLDLVRSSQEDPDVKSEISELVNRLFPQGTH